MFIQVEPTPNPLTLKFLPGRTVAKGGTIFYQSESEVLNSPFAKRMFAVDGVNSVFFGSDFITITKDEDLDWQVLKPMVLGAIADHYNSGEETVIDSPNLKKSEELNENQDDSDIVKQIKELLETRVRPAVAMDGGDIVYQKFEKGIVYLQMQGACSGCPSSAATLKTGIENMLKHYVPEVIEVRPVNE